MVEVTRRWAASRGQLPTGVDVWIVTLGDSARWLQSRWSTLSLAEREKAVRFRARRDRERYAASHAALRAILSGYTDSDPASLRFVDGENGKPRLEAESSAPITFSLSHSADVALCAVVTRGTVGVDVERVKPLLDVDSLARHWLSPQEQSVLATLPAPAQIARFYRYWTAREALLKATGEGLASAEANGRLHADLPPGWTRHHFVPAAGYTAAVVSNHGAGVACWRWEAA